MMSRMEEENEFSPLLKERDACGVGFVVDIKGNASFKVRASFVYKPMLHNF